jgi:O-antigen ligase
MTTLTGRGSRLRRPDVLLGLVACVVVFGVTLADPRTGGILLVVGVAALVVGVLALRSPVAAVLLLIVVSFGRETPIKSVPGDALLLAVYAVVISSLLAVRRGELRAPHLGIPELLMALYVLWNVGSMLMGHTLPDGGGTWKFIVKGAVIPLLVYTVGRFVFVSERSVRVLLWTIVALTVYSTINAIGQIHGPKFLVYPKVTITETGWVDRAVGVFNQPVVNGVLLAVGFLVMLYLASDDRLHHWVRIALVVAAVGAVYGVQLTKTRSALLALVAVLLLGALFASRWRRFFVVPLALGAVAALANLNTLTSSDRDAGGLGSSTEIIDRLNIAATTLRAIGSNPVVGVGVNRFAEYNTDHHISWDPALPWTNGYGLVAHETELGIAAEVGIPGLLLWLAVVVAIVIALVKAYRRLPVGQMYGQKFAFLGVGSIVVWELTAVTVDMRLLDFANILPFLLMGVTVGLAERYTRDGVLLGAPGPAQPGGFLQGAPAPRTTSAAAPPAPARVPEPSR